MSNDIANLIATVGFPICIAMGVGYAMYNVFMIIFNKFIETLDKLVDTNSTLANTVHKRIDKMDNKMDLIYEEIKKSNE